MHSDSENTTLPLPVLHVPNGMPFLLIMKRALSIYRDKDMESFPMLLDVMGADSIWEKKERLRNYFEVI